MSYSYEASLEITQMRSGPEKRTLLYGTLLQNIEFLPSHEKIPDKPELRDTL